MTVAVDSRMLSWPPPSNHGPYYLSTAQSPYNVIPPKNTKELTRDMLFIILEYFSSLLEREFGGITIRLVAHGGACMLLHPGLHELAKRKSLYHSSRGETVPMRKTTRDVDYIRRSFVAEYVGKHKIVDADYKLQRCIRATAVKFGLGADWMNADADVALPMSTTSAGMPYDPIYHASLQPFNVRLYTVFTSKNQKLTIVNVTPAWAVALKLVRYAKWDPGDISLLLMNGTDLNKVHWTTRIIKKWLSDECSAMNYHKWDATRLMDMTGKIDHAVQMVTSIGTNLPPARDRSKSATASGLVGPLAGLTPTPTHSARQSPTGGLPAPNLLDSSSHSSSHSSSVPALQLLSSSTSSHSNSLRPVGPSVNLESGSTGWRPSITNNALALTLADDHDMSSLVRKKKRKDGRKSFSASTSQRTSPWHSFQEIPVPQQVDTSLDLRALGQALPAPTNQSDLPLFIPDFPGDLSSSSWKRPTKERRHSDKHPERRKEKQRRDQERDFFRRFKWEGRGSLLDDPREFVNRGEDHSESDAEEETSNSDEEEESNNRPLEYVPMPAPPVEVYTQEWEEQRHRQEKEWRERHDREPSVLSSDNRASFVGGGNSHDSEPATNSHFRRPQLSQTWPVLSVRNPELMMSIYSPRDSPAIPATQATSPPSLNPDPSAQTHHPVHAHRRSFTSPVGL